MGIDDATILRKIEALEIEVKLLRKIISGSEPDDAMSVVSRLREMGYDLRGRSGQPGLIELAMDTAEFVREQKTFFKFGKVALGFLGASTIAGVIGLIRWILLLE